MPEQILIAEPSDVGTRLDVYLSQKLESCTRSSAVKRVEQGEILVNGNTVAKNYRLAAGDTVRILAREHSVFLPQPQNIPLDIFFEDEYILVVNKPKSMLVHPAETEEDTLVNALLFHCGDKLSNLGSLRPGIVHRIDKDTSGLLVVAKTDAVHEHLARQVESHSMLRRYQGIVYGNIKDDSGTISAPIGRHPVHRTKLCVQPGARHAVTHYRVVRRYPGFTHLELQLETGRTHQIRVHMAHIRHPVAGDVLYGPPKTIKSLRGQCLHAAALGFTHPATGGNMLFNADLPAYFADFIAKISQGV